MSKLSTEQFPNIEAAMPSKGVRSALSYGLNSVLGAVSPSSHNRSKAEREDHDVYGARVGAASGIADTAGKQSQTVANVETALDPMETYHLRAHAGDQARKAFKQ